MESIHNNIAIVFPIFDVGVELFGMMRRVGFNKS
jgi:hypothetical protein